MSGDEKEHPCVKIQRLIKETQDLEHRDGIYWSSEHNKAVHDAVAALTRLKHHIGRDQL